MGKIPNELREAIARNIRDCRLKKFPGRGGGKKCAESFGVSPQQWSPWERGMRTPDELRLSQIAAFFGVTVEYLRRDHSARQPEGGFGRMPYAGPYGDPVVPPASIISEVEPPPYGGLNLPPLRPLDKQVSGGSVAELAILSARILGMVASVLKGVADREYDINNSIAVLRTLGYYLDKELREARKQPGGPASDQY